MDIREQDQAYKRGLVLGLTMAETVILILFCLLLAMAAAFAWHREELDQRDDALADHSERIAELESAATTDADDLRLVSILKEYWERHAPPDVEAREYFTQLVLQVEELGRLRADMERLVERNRSLEEEATTARDLRLQLDEARDALAELDQLEQLRADVERLTERNTVLEEMAATGQNLRDQLDAARDAVLTLAQTEESLAAAGIDPANPDDRARLRRALESVSISEGSDSEGEHDWPPIIILSEADDYHFNVGSAELSDTFHALLISRVIPRIRELIDSYDVDVVEVVGHTDEQRIVERVSNLDYALPGVLREGAPISELIPADNAGLGLARAVSVARVLAADERLSHVVVLPLSGGQLIDEDRMTDWTRTGDVPARRRIEIRVRQSRTLSARELE